MEPQVQIAVNTAEVMPVVVGEAKINARIVRAAPLAAELVDVSPFQLLCFLNLPNSLIR